MRGRANGWQNRRSISWEMPSREIELPNQRSPDYSWSYSGPRVSLFSFLCTMKLATFLPAWVM